MIFPRYAVVRVAHDPSGIINVICPLQHPAGARCAGIEKSVEVGCRCALPQGGVGNTIRGLGPSDSQAGFIQGVRFAQISPQGAEVG